MNTLDALKARKSVRSFLATPVNESIVRAILEAARFAPSGTNTQPWQVLCVSGSAKKSLDKQLLDAFDHDRQETTKEYRYYPTRWIDPFRARRRACGKQLYETLKIRREDKEKQRQQWRRNFSGFGAPTVLYFFIDPILEKGSFIDYGMFLQSIMLAAVEKGLATCPQAAFCEFSTIIKDFLNIEPANILVCGMALGYEDTSAPENHYRTPREDVDEFTQFIQHPPHDLNR